MKKTILMIAALLVASTTVAGSGSSLSDWYIIPAAAHLQGKKGTYWQTDVSIVNPYSWQSITVRVIYLPEGQDNSSATGQDFTLAPSANLTLPDVVSQTFGAQGKGALLVYSMAGASFSVTARTFTGSPETYGQTENGRSLMNPGGATSFITGVSDDGSFRTNVGAVNATGHSITLQITTHGANGSQYGSTQLTLMPWGMSQVALSSFSASFSNGYIKIRCVDTDSDIQWVAYATPVDNYSGDSVFLEDRVDLQGTWAHQMYDLTGLWQGTMTPSQGSPESFSLYILQMQSKISAQVYNSDGYLDSAFTGYEDHGTITISDWTPLWRPCIQSRLTSSQAMTAGMSLSGSLTISAQYYGCPNGTVTFNFTRVPMPAGIGRAMGDSAATVTTATHTRLGSGTPRVRDGR